MGSNGPSWGRRFISVHMAHEAAQRAADDAQGNADELLCAAWNEGMSLLGGPAQPSPTIRAAIAGGFPFLRVHCSNRECRRVVWIALAEIDRPADTQVHRLEGSPCRVCMAHRRGGRAVLEQLTARKGEHGWRHR
jgi:hypothetical protein